MKKLGLLLTFVAWTTPSFAQTPPAAAPAQLTDRVAEEAPSEDVTNWTVGAGAVLNRGNTQSWTANVGTNFRLVRGPHSVGFDWAFNYGQANLPSDTLDEYVDTVRNSNTRLRYDFFVSEMDALFLSIAHRWDTFAGLDTRLQFQIGYQRHFIREENHRFWGEIGYDMTFDNFDPEQILNPTLDLNGDGMSDCDGDAPAAACFVDSGTQLVHAARVYLGYERAVNENVRFLTGLEALPNLQNIEDLRLNFDAAMRSTVIGSLQLELKYKLLFDNVPALRADGTSYEKTDMTFTVNLLYTLM